MPQEKLYTIEDIYSLPEGTRAELIDGRIYYMTPPSRQHQKIVGELYTNINNYIRDNKGTCEAYTAPFAIYLNENNDTYIEPDISVICDKDKLDDKGCKGSPDLIIEVISPGNPEHDYITKLGMYRAAGVREYWIVDSRNQTTKVYFFEAEIFAQNYTFSDTIKVNIYSDLSIDFSQLNI